MPVERELKLSVSPRAAASLAQALKLPMRGRRLHNVYVDTPARELQRRRVAVRLRRDGRRWLQTVKGERGPSSRHEWETPLHSRAFDLSRLPLAAIRRATGVDLQDIAGRLRPVFETSFTRRSRMLIRGATKIEVALDRGYIKAGRRREPISEVELELKAGAMRVLRREASALAKRFALRLDSGSKAERGYRLAEGR